MKYLTPVFYFPDVLNILVRCVLPQLSVFAFFYCPLPVLFPFMAQHRSWYDFLMDALIEGGVMKRLDLAMGKLFLAAREALDGEFDKYTTFFRYNAFCIRFILTYSLTF